MSFEAIRGVRHLHIHPIEVPQKHYSNNYEKVIFKRWYMNVHGFILSEIVD